MPTQSAASEVIIPSQESSPVASSSSEEAAAPSDGPFKITITSSTTLESLQTVLNGLSGLCIRKLKISVKSPNPSVDTLVKEVLLHCGLLTELHLRCVISGVSHAEGRKNLNEIIAKCDGLTKLSLRAMYMDPSQLVALTEKCERLTYLRLACISVSKEVLSKFAENSEALTHLILYGVPLSKDSLEPFATKVPNLQFLDLRYSGCGVSPLLPSLGSETEKTVFLPSSTFYDRTVLTTICNARLIGFDFSKEKYSVPLSNLDMSPWELARFRERNPNLYIPITPHVINAKENRQMKVSTEEWVAQFLHSLTTLKDTHELSYRRDLETRFKQLDLQGPIESRYSQVARMPTMHFPIWLPITVSVLAARGAASAWSSLRSRATTTTTTPEAADEVPAVVTSHDNEITEV
jgi:hypothetical protein